MVLAAALPIGANVFMFSQRYDVDQDLIATGAALSTVLAMFTLTFVLLLLPRVV